MRPRSILRVLGIFGALLVASSAAAQSSPAKEAPRKEAAKKDPKGPPVDVKGLGAKLASHEEAQIRSALDELRIGGPSGAPLAAAVAKALADGLSAPLTLAAIETLADLESEAGSSALAQYSVHRDPKLRRAAVKALTRTKGAAAASALRHALSDQDAVVRGTAASGLGVLKARESVGDLFVALDHRVNEAAASIGMLANPEECDKLAGKLGKVPFDVVTGGLDQILFRPTAEVSDDVKIKVIGRVRELGTMEANKFLKDVQKRWQGTPRVRQAIDQAVLATSGGAQ